MKRTITLSLIMAFLTLSLSAQDNNNLLIGNWKHDTNSANKNLLLYGVQFNFKSDGSFTKIRSENVTEGSWKSTDSNKAILLEYKDGDKVKVNIIELSNGKLIMKHRKTSYTLLKNNNPVHSIKENNIEVKN